VTPQLLKHYRAHVEGARHGGEEELVFTSESRSVVIQGRRFGEFLEHVAPLLDGRHTLEDVLERSSAIFEPDDLSRTIVLLAEHGIVVDADLLGLPDEERVAPQLAFLQEVSDDPGLVLARLAAARVTVVGLGAVGAVAATALAAADVGYLRCVDDSDVSHADPHLAQLFELSDVGAPRAGATARKIRAVNPDVRVDVRTSPLRTDEDVARAVDGADFVLGCLDPGLAGLTDTLNRICLALMTPWSQGTATAFEGIVGPTVIPYETACYRCFLARSIACDDEPEDALRELESRYDDGVDMSAYRENIPFAAGIVGHLLALQAFHALIGLRPRTAGRVLVVDFLTSTMREHVVLRKPWCTACFRTGEAP
jgi:bacteriocin biosynthesis cyclodehydratase domain-containing protein